jgi:hypothetical protein
MAIRLLLAKSPAVSPAPVRTIQTGTGAWQTSTHDAPAISAIRPGAILTAALTAPAAGTTSSKARSETSQ